MSILDGLLLVVVIAAGLVLGELSLLGILAVKTRAKRAKNIDKLHQFEEELARMFKKEQFTDEKREEDSGATGTTDRPLVDRAEVPIHQAYL